MKYSILVSILILSGCSSALEHEAKLMMQRSDREPTYRASFRFRQDCELIAKAIDKQEPFVTWYCD